VRASPGVAAIVLLGLAWALTMHTVNWAHLAHFAQVRAFADGRPEIDRWHWETLDKGWVDGHFYSVKAPGVAALSLPFYLAIEHTGGVELARQGASNARAADHPRWTPEPQPPVELYGYDQNRARITEQRVEEETPLIWALTLVVAVIPAVLLLLGVRWAADRLEPGYGTAAAITLGLSTIVMTFASEYFSHVIAAFLGFAAFLLLMRERDGPPRTGLVAAAGLLAGLAVTFEFQTGLVGMILLPYALSRRCSRLQRSAVYGAGLLFGAAPALVFNVWAFGDPLEFAYSSAVSRPGRSGHEVLGLNSYGFFGIGLPDFGSAVDLLFANRGALVLTPIIFICVLGVVLMRKRHRAEALTIAAIGVAYFLYNTGYFLPMGGGTPGPRFLFPALPFLALGLAVAFRQMPALTLSLAIPSALFMVVGALTFPLLSGEGPGTWAEQLTRGEFEHTLLTVLGVGNGWLGISPVLVSVAAAVVLAGRATPAFEIGKLWPISVALAGWATVSVVAPTIAKDYATPLHRDNHSLWLIAAGCAISLGSLLLLKRRNRVHPESPEGPADAIAPEPALRGRIS
jgi:hypothetical protein